MEKHSINGYSESADGKAFQACVAKSIKQAQNFVALTQSVDRSGPKHDVPANG